jgi:hypothetical protein
MRRLIALLLIVGMTVNCASIVHGTRQEISIQSTPTGADVVVKCAKDAPFNAPSTPAEITLKRNRGGCAITVWKKGYEPRTFFLTRQLSGWYIANILIGGVIGLIIDAADGAMFNLSPNQIVALLPQVSAPVAVESPIPRETPVAVENRIVPRRAPVPANPPVPRSEPTVPRVESQPVEKPEPSAAAKSTQQPVKSEEGSAVTPSSPPVEAIPRTTPTKTEVAQREVLAQPKKVAQPPTQVRATERQSPTQPIQKPERLERKPIYRIQVVRDAKDAWKVLVTNDVQAVLGCTSLKRTSREYDFAGSFPVRDVQEDAARMGANVVLTPTTAGRQSGVIFSCPATK